MEDEDDHGRVIVDTGFTKLGITQWGGKKRKMNEFPVQEIKGLRLGVQPHGIVMRQKMGVQEGTATIGWKDIYEWYSSPDFILVNFKVKTPKGDEQQGAYILPKRMDSKNFSFNTVRKHLNETVGAPKTL